MIAVDSSTVVDFMKGSQGKHVEAFIVGLKSADIVLPPVVISEVLSDPGLPQTHRQLLLDWPMLDLLPGYWIRAGDTRAKILRMKLRARLPDTLIAQSCIDYDLSLITRDPDFRHFATYCGLKLA